MEPRLSGLRRRTLGLSKADVLGKEKADVAAKEALPPPSPHIMQWQLWRAHAEKLRLFWGAFGPTLARRGRRARPPKEAREVEPPLFGPEAPKEIGEHPRVVVETDPVTFDDRGCRNLPGHGAAPAAPIRNRAAPAAPIRNYPGGVARPPSCTSGPKGFVEG